MDKTIIPWTNPPDPEQLNHERHDYGHYHPGQIFNCRCYSAPLIRIDDVDWPHKTYWDGQIQMMNKSRFIELTGYRGVI
jgi:hypothetical protein